MNQIEQARYHIEIILERMEKGNRHKGQHEAVRENAHMAIEYLDRALYRKPLYARIYDLLTVRLRELTRPNHKGG